MILVTGGTGLVGSHLLLDLVKSGKRVRALHRHSSSMEAVRRVFTYEHSEEEAERFFDLIEWRVADILDVPALEDAFEGVSSVYHCAAKVTFNPSDYRKVRKTNIEGTANIANLCIANKVEKLCFASSIATLDKKLGECEINEKSDWNKERNHSMYAISKYGAEIEVWRASQEGVPVVIVNPGVIIGPGFWNSGSGVIFKRLHKGLNYHFPKTTGFVGVDDVVRAMRRLMASPIENEQFVLVSENLSFERVFKLAAKAMNKPGPSKQLKPWMVKLGWVFEKIFSFTGRKRQLTRDSSKSLFDDSFYSSNKIKEQLKFEFEPMERVIERTGKLYLEEIKE